jgi:hypothetical protein
VNQVWVKGGTPWRQLTARLIESVTVLHFADAASL